MIIPINPSIIEYKSNIRNLCRVPYHGHSKGCPNFGKKQGCPPNQKLINEIFDFEKELYLIYNEFNVGNFAQRMLEMHPEWENFPRQIYNPRRWQPVARKEHKQEIINFFIQYPNSLVNSSPEANGVNVSKLMKSVGIELNWNWPPEHNLENKTYIVSLGGYKIK